MSDFTSNFWSVFVAVVSIISIVYCAVLLWFSSKVKVNSHNPQDGTTGHVWDENLQEMNNPLPRWWLWLFIITMVFAVVYGVAYPGLGSFAGKLGWSSAGQYDAEVAKANQALEPLYAKFAGMPPEDVAKDPQAMAIGDRLFGLEPEPGQAGHAGPHIVLEVARHRAASSPASPAPTRSRARLSTATSRTWTRATRTRAST